MKRRLLLLFQPVCMAALVACVMEGERDWKEEMGGIYTTQYEQPYSTGFDTLFINKIKTDNSTFRIERHTGYQRKNAVEGESTMHRIETWTGIPDDTQPVLHIFPSGRELWFNPERQEVNTGTVTYHQLK